MYLGSPRMAEMVIGEKVSLEEMGGARYAGVSGVGHFLVKSDEEGIDLAKRYLSYFPTNWREEPPPAPPADPIADTTLRELVPEDENKPFDVIKLIEAIVDGDSFLEVQKRWAKELVVGYARIDGRVVGIVANQPKQRGGVLFVDSSDKAARIWTCSAFNIPLLFLADVPGFMIGTAVERGDHPRRREDDQRGVRGHRPEAVGDHPQGLRRRPLRDGGACLRRRLHRAARRPHRRDGPAGRDQRAVFYNQVQAIEDPDERAAFVEKLRTEYAEEIDILHLASELVVDAVIQPEDLRAELARRYGSAPARRASGRTEQPGHARLDTPPLAAVRAA